MTFKFHFNSNLPKMDETPSRVEMWYDRTAGIRSWVVQTMNKDGDVLGESTYVHSKREALAEKKYREENIG